MRMTVWLAANPADHREQAQGDSLSDLRQRVRSDANVSTHRFVPRPHDARGHLPLESAAKATHIPAAALAVAPSSLDRCSSGSRAGSGMLISIHILSPRAGNRTLSI